MLLFMRLVLLFRSKYILRSLIFLAEQKVYNRFLGVWSQMLFCLKNRFQTNFIPFWIILLGELLRYLHAEYKYLKKNIWSKRNKTNNPSE